VDARREAGEHQRVDDEDRSEEGSGLNEDVPSVRAENRLAHASAKHAAKTALFRLLEQHDSSKQQARQHFYNIKQTDEETHFLMTFL